MTNHPFDLKGIDTGKIGNNKYVNYTLKDLERDQDVSRAGALELLGGVKLEGLKPVTPTLKKPESVLTRAGQFLFGHPGREQELVGGKLVSKDRQKGLGRFTAGLTDLLTANLTDFDQRGGGFLGLTDVNPISGLGGKPTDYQLPKVIKEALAKADEKSKVDEGSQNPVDNVMDYVKAQTEYEKIMDAHNRKGKILDAAIESANMRANMPFITNTMKDLSTFKQRQLLDAEKIKQALPNAQQARLLAADQGFATQAGAIAGQQDSATRFAGLGMQRGFGQLS